jgi:nucleoside diphosphate kinase
MQAFGHNVIAIHGEGVAMVVQGVHVAEQQQNVVKEKAPAEAPVGAVHSDTEWDIEIDTDSSCYHISISS